MIQWFFISGYVLQNMLQVGFGKTFQNLPYFDQSVAYGTGAGTGTPATRTRTRSNSIS